MRCSDVTRPVALVSLAAVSFGKQKRAGAASAEEGSAGNYLEGRGQITEKGEKINSAVAK